MTWIPLGVYVAGYLGCWRTVCWHIANDIESGGRVGGDTLVVAILAGSTFALFWPLIFVGLCARKVYAWRGESITALIVPRSQKRVVALDERERRIAKLEREVGIK